MSAYHGTADVDVATARVLVGWRRACAGGPIDVIVGGGCSARSPRTEMWP